MVVVTAKSYRDGLWNLYFQSVEFLKMVIMVMINCEMMFMMITQSPVGVERGVPCN